MFVMTGHGALALHAGEIQAALLVMAVNIYLVGAEAGNPEDIVGRSSKLPAFQVTTGSGYRRIRFFICQNGPKQHFPRTEGQAMKGDLPLPYPALCNKVSSLSWEVPNITTLRREEN